MQKDNFVGNKVTAVDGTTFELTGTPGKWGYDLLVNGAKQKKLNQAWYLWQDGSGLVYQADNNGTAHVWENGGWKTLFRDNKAAVTKFMQDFGLPNIFAPGYDTLSKPSIMPKVSTKPVSPPYTPSQIMDIKTADLLPPDSALSKPLGTGVTLLTELIKPTDPATMDTSTGGSPTLTAKGLTFSNPFIIGGMVLAVIVMFFVAKKYAK